MNLLDQRCVNHAQREAAVQCPSCKRFFCRECVTEHAGRMVCVSCVAMLARVHEKMVPAQRARWAVLAMGGLVLAWLVFYYLGLTLARIPSDFHGAEVAARYQYFPIKSIQSRDHREPTSLPFREGTC